MWRYVEVVRERQLGGERGVRRTVMLKIMVARENEPWGVSVCWGSLGLRGESGEVAGSRTFSWSLGTDILLEVVIEFQESREDP